jgi:hypothetical protein
MTTLKQKTYYPFSIIVKNGRIGSERIAWARKHLGKKEVEWDCVSGGFCRSEYLFQQEKDAVMFALKWGNT